jgi:hypothetical protein
MATASGLTNSELIEYLGLPSDTITKLQTAMGETYQATANEFLTALYNKVLYSKVSSMEFTNPFKKYDSYPINFGDTIENIFVELPKGYTYDKDATDPFTKVVPSVKALYQSINYELQYETTIQDSLLRRACVNEYGFMNLIDSILGTLAQAMSLDEYDAVRAVLGNKAIYAGGEVETYTKGSTDSETAEKITKIIVDAVTFMKLPSDKCNALGVLTSSKAENLLLVIKADLLNSINLDYLSGVYNLSKIDLINNIIPVASFQVKDKDGNVKGEDIDFAVIDTTGFENHVALQDGGMIYNPKGKYTNHFYNLWKIVSFKQFCNARAFKVAE